MKKAALIGLIVALLVPTAALADASDFEFDPETGSILKYNGTELEVVVPDAIDGVPVVRIGYDAFMNEDVQITSIVLPEGLEIIDEDAFHYQGSLKTVDCPDSVRVIAEDAFNYGYFSEEFDWPESLEEIGECAFYNTRLAGTVVLPPKVAMIGESAFGATEIETIVMPGTDMEIEANAFEDCGKLKQIVFPATISDEKLAEYTELFAEMNPDTDVVRAEPAISEEDFARYGGFWYLNTVTQAGIECSAADLGMEFTLELNEDGTAVMDTGEPEEGTWAVDGDEMALLTEGAEDVVFTEEDGILVASGEDMAMTFGREPAQPGYIPGEPVKAESADNFNGTWNCVRISVYGMNVPAELFADSLQDLIGIDSLDMEIRGSNVRMTGDEIEAFTFADGALSSQSGMERTLTLLDDGMLACDLGNGTLYYEKVSEDSTLPEADGEPTKEPAEASASEPVSVEPVADVKYSCEKAIISGYDIDPSVLGGEYSVTFHSDGSLTLILAGAVIDDLEWQVKDAALAADYYGTGELRFVPGEKGYELDYRNSVRFYFTVD